MVATVKSWPMTEHDGPVRVGDVVKLPVGGLITKVVSVAFGLVDNGAYVNGFWVGRDERLELVSRKEHNPRHAMGAENVDNVPEHYRVDGFDTMAFIDAVIDRDCDVERPSTAKNRAEVLAYVVRAPRKGGLADYKKAQDYLGRIIESMEG